MAGAGVRSDFPDGVIACPRREAVSCSAWLSVRLSAVWAARN